MKYCLQHPHKSTLNANIVTSPYEAKAIDLHRKPSATKDPLHTQIPNSLNHELL